MKTERLLLTPDTRNFLKIKAMILACDAPETLKLSLCLAAEEIFVNICSYAFTAEMMDQAEICFTLEVSDHIELSFEDNGMPYDPREQVTDPEEYDLDTQVGGLGKLIAFTVSDDVRYVYERNRNHLTMLKYIPGEKNQG